MSGSSEARGQVRDNQAVKQVRSNPAKYYSQPKTTRTASQTKVAGSTTTQRGKR